MNKKHSSALVGTYTYFFKYPATSNVQSVSTNLLEEIKLDIHLHVTIIYASSTRKANDHLFDFQCNVPIAYFFCVSTANSALLGEYFLEIIFSFLSV